MHALRLPSHPDTLPGCDIPIPATEPAYRPLWLAVVFDHLPAGGLESLASPCQRYTPQINLAPPDAVLLEIRGSLSLFGGLSPLIENISQTLAREGHEVTLAATPVPSASLILARQGRGLLIEDDARLRAVLAGLPVRGLEIPAEQVRRLERMGISHLGDAWRLPRDGLTRRFGTELPICLDRLSGRLTDLRPRYRLPLRFSGSCLLPEDTVDVALILVAARRLLRRLLAFLKAHDAAIGAFLLILKPRRRSSIEYRPSEYRVGLRSRTRDLRRLERLLAEHLHALRLPAPVLELELRAEDIGRYSPVTESLLPGGNPESERIRETLEARLGRGCITVPACRADHRPERAGGECPSTGVSHTLRPGTKRPLWLLDPPEPLAGDSPPRWRGRQLRLLSGPERIESGWWDGEGRRRDYYRAVTADGGQLWIFRDLDSPRAWRLHGYWR